MNPQETKPEAEKTDPTAAPPEGELPEKALDQVAGGIIAILIGKKDQEDKPAR